MQVLNWREIAVRLKALRTQRQLTIERLAELIGVSTSFINLIERGETGISAENLYKLSQVFNCTIDYLLTGTESDAQSSTHSKFETLNTALFDYTDDELKFVLELSAFLKNRVLVNS